MLAEGETLSAFVGSAVRRAVEHRLAMRDFDARCDAALKHYLVTGKAFSSDKVLSELRRRLAEPARSCSARPTKRCEFRGSMGAARTHGQRVRVRAHVVRAPPVDLRVRNEIGAEIGASTSRRTPLPERWFQPFTHTTCFSVCTTSTKSRCASITASMSL